MNKDRSTGAAKRWQVTLVCVLLGAALGGFAPDLRADGHEAQSLDSIKWMLGTWSRDARRGEATEAWRQVDDGVFLGEGRAVGDGGESRLLETLMLVELSGEVFYFAKVPENPFPTPFRLKEATESTAVFENPEHDFPKRLEYRLEGGELSVAVSGADDQGFTLRFSQSAP